MSKLLVAGAVLVAAAAAAPTAQAWTPPTILSGADEANVLAQPAFGGSVLTGWLKRTAALSKDLGVLEPISKADPFETVWASGLDGDGHAVVVTVRKHKPVQRIRAAIAGGRTYTISDRAHSATQPRLAVAPDGTAVAVWQWHDPAGWRVQAAIRRPGAARFHKPQNIGPPAAGKLRPNFDVAAGDGGRAALTWQVQSDQEDAALHVVTATDGRFGADQVLPGGGLWADVSLAVAPDGATTVAYLGYDRGPTALRVASGTTGAPLRAPAVLSTGGTGTSSGPQTAVAVSADGTTTVAWAKPGDSFEQGGALEVFTRAPGAPGFGPAQTLAQGAQGLAAAGGPGASAALTWMSSSERENRLHWRVFAALRGADGTFAAPQQLSTDAHNALWPSIALTSTGKAIAAWVTNDNGGGSGEPTAAISD